MASDRFGSYDRIPPQNMEAEQAVLGSMLIERPAIEKAGEILKPEDFYRDAHRFIFEAMMALAERDEPVDLITLEEELNSRSLLETAGGHLYLLNLMDAPSTAANIEYYAKLVEEKAILRRVIDAGTRVQGLAYSEYDSIDDVVDQAEKLVFDVGQRRMGQFFYHLRPLLNEELDRIEKRYENKGITTGRLTPFDDLNYMTAGFQPSDLIIVAARPSMGKCVRADTLLDHPYTGERLTIETWVQNRIGAAFGFGETGEVRIAPISDWIDSGIQPCYRVRTRTGRSVEVTGHHPFLTIQGWTPLHDLRVGNKIAVPRAVPAFGAEETWPLEYVRLLAYFLAEGGLTDKSPEFTNTDPVLIADFQAIIARYFPECALRQSKITYVVAQPRQPGKRSGTNPVTQWLRDLGVWNKLAAEKRFPVCVWRWSRRYLAEFLRVLFSCDGTIYAMGGYPRIEFAVASSELASDVHHALIRFGIVSKLWQKSERCWCLEITEPESVAAYQEQIGWVGEKSTRKFRTASIRRSNSGHAPQEVWKRVRVSAAQQGLSLTELARRSGERVPPSGGYNPHMTRGLPQHRLTKYAQILGQAELQQIAGRDIYWDEIISIEATGSHQVYDLTVPDGENFIAQDICVHNTALTVQLCQYVALHEKLPVAIFSLEMSKEQLVARMIGSESKVNMHDLRVGFLKSDDWKRVGEGISRLSEAPIYIDDTPDVSAMEMRAKCRRLKAEHGLGMIMIDYMQLMRSHKRTENRNQELSEIARACKGLARELKIPVIALSQLSRAVESRPDKRPMLSDLRECVTGDTLLIEASTGRQTPIRDLKAGDSILGVGPSQKIGTYAVKDVWSTGIKPVFTLTTRTGRSVTASANHPFLTATGWKRLDELKVEDVIATAMQLPTYGQEKPECAALCRLLGYLTGDGTFQTHRSIGFCGSDKTYIEDVIEIVKDRFPEVAWHLKKQTEGYTEGEFTRTFENGYGKPGGNPLREWLRCIDVYGHKDCTKFVPDYVFEAGEIGAKEFLTGYFASDGCVKTREGRWSVHFDTVSRRLAIDVQSLLLRLGIVASVNKGTYSSKSTQPLYRVYVYSFASNLLRFACRIRPLGRKGELLEEMIDHLPHSTTNGSLFSLPVEVSQWMFERTKHLRQQGRKLEGRRLYWKHQGKCPNRASCETLALKLQDEELAMWAASDLLWEPIVHIEPAGEQETFDIKVECANFLANGIVAHNSGAIEAEADVVMFIYRDAYYKMKEAVKSEEDQADAEQGRTEFKMEEAELIIAKQRNGPTGRVIVGFMPQFARFENLDRTHREDREE